MALAISLAAERNQFGFLRPRSFKMPATWRLAQGAYLYEFQELPAAIVGILDAHFAQVEKDLATKIDSLAPTFKPKLILVKR